MNFLYPLFLFGLFAVLIPIIIHLFNFRFYKTVYFSNVSFLKDIKKESKSKSRIKHYLILIMRVLAVSSLVIAFAQPYIPKENQQVEAKNRVGIYLDNSFSTEAESKYGKLSELAKNKARQIVEAYSEDTKFFFLTNDFSAKHQHIIDKEQLRDFLSETQISPTVKKISEVINKTEIFLSDKDSSGFRNSLYLISDFQKTISDFEEIKSNLNIDINLVPLESEQQNNLYVDSIWFESPNRMLNQPEELFVKIYNNSNESFHNIPLRLYIGGTLKTPGSFNIEANSSTIQKLTFTNNKTGIVSGYVEISDYPVIFDNKFYFTYNIDTSKKILIISPKGKSKYIDAVFANDNFFKITHFSEGNIKTSEISSFDVVFLDGINLVSSGIIQEAVNFAANGGNLIIFPNPDGNIESYNNLFNRLNVNYIISKDTSDIYIGSINYKSTVFQNIFKQKEENPDLPLIKKRSKFSNITKADEETILYAENNDKILSKTSFGSGIVYIFSHSADDKGGNFVYHSLWAPLLYNMAILKNEQRKLFYIIGEDKVLNIPSYKNKTDEVLHIVDSEKKYDFIPTGSNVSFSGNIIIPENLKVAGNYTAGNNNENITGLAFNYNRSESDIIQYKEEELKQIIIDESTNNLSLLNQSNEILIKDIKEQNTGKQLWKLFIVLSLLFLLIEIIGLRFLK